MARNVKPGITFYRVTSGHITEADMRLLFNEHDSHGYYIWACIRDYAFKNLGWHFDTRDDDEMELFASEYCKKGLGLIKVVIATCIKRGLFEADLYREHKILTNFEMQDVFLFASKDRRSKGSFFQIPAALWLVPIDEKRYYNIEFTGVKKPRYSSKEESANETKQKLNKTISKAANAGAANNSLKISSMNTSEDNRTRRKNFTSPGIAEVKSYFLQLYNPKKTGNWGPERCNLEANKFFANYQGNGWKQGSSNIVDWKATADKWVLRADEGTYNVPGTSSGNATPAIQPQRPAPAAARSNIDQNKKEINYCFEKYCSQPLYFDHQFIEVHMYHYLLQYKLFPFTDDKAKEIKKAAEKAVKDSTGVKKGDDHYDSFIEIYIKKLAVIELFKLYHKEGKEYIFNN